MNRADKFGRTPVYVAAHKGHTAAIEALGKLGADVEQASDFGTPLSRVLNSKGKTAAADALRRLGAMS